MEQSILAVLIQEQQLPENFAQTVTKWYLPLLDAVYKHKRDGPLVLGVQGSQGSGKSTLASFLCLLAKETRGAEAISLSLDDFYLTHEERLALSKTVHPLLATRGVPGTHDIELAVNTIQALKKCSMDSPVKVPRFSKATDDRLPESEWDTVKTPLDLIIFEGWCVGCDAENDEALVEPANELERIEDGDGTWRRYVNHALENDYQRLFTELDQLAVLLAPSFECVYDWRWLQEKKLHERLKQHSKDAPARLLDEDGVRRFISHYERLTRHALECLPDKADWLLPLDKNHNITELRVNS